MLVFSSSHVRLSPPVWYRKVSRRGQGEFPWATGGQDEVAVDDGQARTIYNIALMQ